MTQGSHDHKSAMIKTGKFLLFCSKKNPKNFLLKLRVRTFCDSSVFGKLNLEKRWLVPNVFSHQNSKKVNPCLGLSSCLGTTSFEGKLVRFDRAKDLFILKSLVFLRFPNVYWDHQTRKHQEKGVIECIKSMYETSDQEENNTTKTIVSDNLPSLNQNNNNSICLPDEIMNEELLEEQTKREGNEKSEESLDSHILQEDDEPLIPLNFFHSSPSEETYLYDNTTVAQNERSKTEKQKRRERKKEKKRKLPLTCSEHEERGNKADKQERRQKKKKKRKLPLACTCTCSEHELEEADGARDSMDENEEMIDKKKKHSCKKKRAKKKRSKRQSAENESDSDYEVIPTRTFPNYFVAVRVSNPAIHSCVKVIQDSMVNFDKSLKSALIPISTLHITLMVMHLQAQEVEKAVEVLKNCKSDFSAVLDGTLSMTFEGLAHFKNEVIFGKIKDEDEVEKLKLLATAIRNHYEKNGIPITDDRPFTPHLTLLKLSRIKIRKKNRLKKVPPESYSSWLESELGKETVNEVLLCSMNHMKDEEGFYHCVGSVKISGNTETIEDQEITEPAQDL